MSTASSRRPSVSQDAGAPSAAPPAKKVGKALQTAVRSLKPTELSALQGENKRLLEFEQSLVIRAQELNEREERVGEEVGRLKAQLERTLSGENARDQLFALEARVALERSEAANNLTRAVAARVNAEKERDRLAAELRTGGSAVLEAVLSTELRAADQELGILRAAIAHADAWHSTIAKRQATEQNSPLAPSPLLGMATWPALGKLATRS